MTYRYHEKLLAGLVFVALLALNCNRDAIGADQADSVWYLNEMPILIRFYQDLHRNPELSLAEKRTSGVIAGALKNIGAEVTTGVGGFGVVGVLKNGDGPTVLVRSDMDALPLTEATGAAYASQAKSTDAEGRSTGVMHACGHDIHMACLVGCAKWLADHRAEERVIGARAMLDAGLYSRFPKPSAALALHVAHDLPAGSVGYISGPAFASSTSVDITVKGRGGHGAMPHTANDPIVQAAMLVVDLQSIVSRQVSPVDTAVVTVGSIHGGTKHNIIPDEVHLQLTVRAFREETRELLLDSIRRKAEGLAHAHKATKPLVEVKEGIGRTVNTPELVARVLPSLVKELGEERVELVEPTTGAEDFGQFGEGGVPTFMFRLGTVNQGRLDEAKKGGKPLPSLHSSGYLPVADMSIQTGVKAMSAAVVRLLPAKSSK